MNVSIFDYVKVALTFAKGILSPLKKEYDLKFVNDDGTWYIDMPWAGDRYNLSMVAGSKRMLTHIDTDKDNKVRILVRPSKKQMDLPGYFELVQKEHALTKGSFYAVNNLAGFNEDIWICPVTLCVLGCYPKYIYVKQIG